jgi:DNA-binding NarL/FixJ family response regulator
MHRPLHIVIVEDKGRLAASLRADLELFDDLVVAAVYPDGLAAVTGIPEQTNLPDLVLMDVEMPRLDGIQATAQLKERYPQLTILMMTVFEDEQTLFAAIRAGADGYLLKGTDPEELHRAIHEATGGGAPLSPAMARKSLRLLRQSPTNVPAPEPHSLSEREVEVLQQLAAGRTYRQAAENLFISEATVRKHVENIYRKLRVENKVSAVARGRGLGILD